MEFHMINITYAALHMCAQTEKTTFSCKDDCTLTKHTRRWTYSALRHFFSWKLKFICRFWIQNHFCPILEDWDIWKTKGGSEVDKLIFILTRNSTCGSRLVSANHKRPQTGPCFILSTPYWSLLELFKFVNKFHIFFIFIALQNLQQLKILRIFGSITSTYHKSHFVLQISWLPKIVQKWFCIQNLRMDLSFQEKKTVCKSVTWFTSYANSRIQENSWVFFKRPVS